MSVISNSPKVLLTLAMLASGSVVAHAQSTEGEADVSATAYSEPAQATEGPEVKGIISARSGDRMQVTSEDGAKTVIAITDATKISASKGFLGLGRDKLLSTQLLNGIPVTVKTQQSGGELVATQIKMQNKDYKVASMIYNGTDQRFGEQAAATEALRGRMADIDKYNVKSTTNVNFAVGKSALTPQAKADLCAAAAAAENMDNALLLVVGYTDSTGSEELNQTLSEKRASSVVNYLQQACRWKPYRMLTPTGMSEADPMADNTTEEGKAQNRRVAVNVLVSKGLDGI